MKRSYWSRNVRLEISRITFFFVKKSVRKIMLSDDFRPKRGSPKIIVLLVMEGLIYRVCILRCSAFDCQSIIKIGEFVRTGAKFLILADLGDYY